MTDTPTGREAGVAEAERRFGATGDTPPTPEPITGRESGLAEAERRFGNREETNA